nr:uncharacterized protein LOC115257836 [Aedes albopictus]
MATVEVELLDWENAESAYEEIEVLNELSSDNEFSNVEFTEEHLNEVPEASEVVRGRKRPVSRGPTKTKRAKKRTGFFSSDEKKKLAAEVQLRPILWDLAHRDHYNGNAIALAWKQVGSVLCRTGSDCKTAWIALRESHRYHQKTRQKKSGSAGGTPLEGQTSNDWEFAEDMSFLPNKSKQRSTYTSFVEEHETEFERQDDSKDDSVIVSDFSSNYSYTRPNDRSKNKSRENDTVIQLSDNLQQLIEIQKNTSHSAARSEMVPKLVHHTQLANIDRMLQKLPDDEIEDVCFEMTSLVLTKIKQNRCRN